MSEKIEHSHDIIYLLLWQDCLERLDMLLLESRHIQSMIIYALREPVFYKVLREEEGYLWTDKSFVEQIEGVDQLELEVCLSKFIDFPDPKLLNEIKESDPDWAVRLGENWKMGEWGEDQRKHYLNLYTLQKLKKEIYLDKISLNKFAFENGIDKKATFNLDINNKARFLILRSGVIHKMISYVQRVRDFETAYNNAAYSDQRDYPSPVTRRRREFGVYMNFLSDRTTDILRDLKLLVAEFGVDKGFSNQLKDTKYIFHTSSHEFFTEINLLKTKKNKNVKEGYRFLNSSFLMPERPDLQPYMAHKISEDIVHKYVSSFQNGEDYNFDFDSDNFAKLTDDIYNAASKRLKEFNSWPLHAEEVKKEDWIWETTSILLCDFLAVSLKGYSYIYALTMSHIGFNTSDLFVKDKDGVINLSSVYNLQMSPTRGFLDRSWYLRIMLLLKWMEVVHHDDEADIDKVLTRGTKNVCNQLYDFLDLVMNQYPDVRRPNMEKLDEKKDSDYNLKDSSEKWKELTEDLSAVIEASPIRKKVKTWRKNRAANGVSDNINSDPPKSSNDMPLSMSRLDNSVRQVLYDLEYAIKKTDSRPHGNKITKEEFNNIYGVEGSSKNSRMPNHDFPYPMYRHLYDIPWQSAITRSIDLILLDEVDKNKPKNSSPKETVLDTLSYDFSLGRGIFFVGLEFAMHQNDSALRRARTVLHLLKGIKSGIKIKPHFEALEKKLKTLSEINASSVEEKEKEKRRRNLEKECEVYLNEMHGVPESLKMFLNIRKTTGNWKNFYEVLSNALGQRVEIYMVNKTMIAGSYPVLTQEDKRYGLGLFDIMSEDFSIPCHVSGKESFRYTMIGRFDFFSITRTNYLCRCMIPSFDPKGPNENENFPNFFMQRQMGVRLALGEKKIAGQSQNERTNPQGKIFAMISVSLQRRNFRLDFVYRLLSERSERKKMELLEDILFSTNDYVLLVDGWADVIIVLHEDDKKVEAGMKTKKKKSIDICDKIERVFAIQNAIYQDFLVDRTELSFSTAIINRDFAKCFENKFNLSSKVRLMEDRLITSVNEEVITNFKKFEKKNKDSIEVTRLPGRLDFSVNVKRLPDEDNLIKDFYSGMFKSRFLDRLDTSIELKINLND